MSNDNGWNHDAAGSSPAQRSGAGDDPAVDFDGILDDDDGADGPLDGDDLGSAGVPPWSPDGLDGPRPFGADCGKRGAPRVPGAPRAPGAPGRPRRGRQLVAPEQAARATRTLTAEQRLLILDAWLRSGLPARDFATLVGVSHHTLYSWKRRFDEQGPVGLTDRATQRGATGSRLPEATKRAILMLKKANPDWGCQRLSDVLYRGPGLGASAKAVARVLKEAGYVTEERPTRPHPDRVRRFERARSNQLWQSDLFSFVLKRQNRRVHLVAFMDDHSRFIVGYGLHASQNTALVMEVFRAAVTSCGVPEEVLTDNGTQYVTWRGTSQFSRELNRRGVKHIVASPRRPQTLGKVERFWGTLWRECLEAAIFIDLEDARKRVGLFIDHYNFHRPHQGIEGMTPADRFFGASSQVLQTLKARVDANSLDLARHGVPKQPFYVTGQVGGRPFSVHAEGERVFMVGDDGERREVELTAPVPSDSTPAGVTLPEPVSAQGIVSSELHDRVEPDWSTPAAPGTSPIDRLLEGPPSAGDPQQRQPGGGGAS